MINSTITPEPTLTGIRFGNRIIGYSTAVRQIDNGNYDKRIPDGLDLIACIMEGIESGWFMPCIEKQIILWRWLVVAVFIAEEQEKNGTVDVQNDKGGVDTAVVYTGKTGSISIYRGLSASRSLTISRRAQLKNTGLTLASRWRCVCIRTWL